MTKKTKSTVETLLESMSPKERQKFDEELKDFALSELVSASKARDEVSVRRLTKLARCFANYCSKNT
jgi:hypothetical protein